MTQDSVHLRGTYWEPRDAGRAAVTLIHDVGGRKEDWLPIVPILRTRGWGILTFDLRGHGESVRQDLQPNDLVPNPANLRSPTGYPADLKAAIGFIERQPHTESGTLAAIGVGLGADLAYAAAGRGWGTASTVMIGLDDSRARELGGSGPFTPRNAYLIYGADDPAARAAAETFVRTASRPSEIHAYAGTASTGRDLLFEKSPELVVRMIAWIEKTL